MASQHYATNQRRNKGPDHKTLNGCQDRPPAAPEKVLRNAETAAFSLLLRHSILPQNSYHHHDLWPAIAEQQVCPAGKSNISSTNSGRNFV